MLKQQLILGFLCFASYTLTAQEVIGTTGTTLKGKTIELEYTLGETAVTTIKNENYELDQGFHKGLIIEPVSNDITKVTKTLNISVWPNPATDVFNIKTERKKVSYKLVNINMQVLDIEGTIPSNSSKSIDISKLNASTYFLYLTDTENSSKVLKIIKSN